MVWGGLTVLGGFGLTFGLGFFMPTRFIKNELKICILLVMVYFTVKFAINVYDMERIKGKSYGFVEEVCKEYQDKFSDFLITSCNEARKAKEVFVMVQAFEYTEDLVFENLFYVISYIKQGALSLLLGAGFNHFLRPMLTAFMDTLKNQQGATPPLKFE